MKKIASLLAAVLLAPVTGFSFAHTWFIQEVYTNASGSVQFVEFFGNTLSGEIFMDGLTLKFDIGASTQNTMTFNNASATDGDANLAGNTLNKHVLIGTANIETLYGVKPDYILSANFLSQGATNSVIFSANSDRVNLTNLPTNGIGSLDGLIGNGGSTAAATAVNSQATPTNFAGQSATIPEPASVGFVALSAAALGVFTFARRRR